MLRGEHYREVCCWIAHPNSGLCSQLVAAGAGRGGMLLAGSRASELMLGVGRSSGGRWQMAIQTKPWAVRRTDPSSFKSFRSLLCCNSWACIGWVCCGAGRSTAALQADPGSSRAGRRVTQRMFDTVESVLTFSL